MHDMGTNVKAWQSPLLYHMWSRLSCVSARARQDLAIINPIPCLVSTEVRVRGSRYEELKRQLGEAQEAAQIEDEEAEVARAADALARLTAPLNTPRGPKAGAAAAAASGGPPPSTQTGGDGGSASTSRRVCANSCISTGGLQVYCVGLRL